MERKTALFVEFQYQEPFFSVSYEKEVDSLNPFRIEDDGIMNGFRFVEKTTYFDGYKPIKTVNEGCTSWVYYGTRCSCADVLKKYGNTPANRIMITQMINDGCIGFCINRSGGLIPLKRGDTIYGELAKEKNNNIK